MGRFLRCDQCSAEITNEQVMETSDPWPAILTADADVTDPCFCKWSCLAEWALNRALTEVTGGLS